jgi:hypothetical protein
MSELKVDKVSPRTGTYVSLNTVGMKNIIINGDMSLAQRGTSEASITTSGYYTVDRFKFFNSSLGTFTMSQSTDVPTGQGFATSLKLDCTTADAAPAAADNLRIQQIFEGQNLQYLKKGTANAVSTTLSFWVKSTKTGTFIAELYDLDNSRQISKSYTVDVTNTWEKKTITFEGDTTGALDNDNGDSLSLNFWLGAGTDYTSGTLSTTWTSVTTANRAVGQVNIADSTANDFYITGVQLEAGTTASDFEFLPVDVNLGRCLRYFWQIQGVSGSNITLGMGFSNSSTNNITYLKFPTTMRTAPSVTGTGLEVSDGNSYTIAVTAISVGQTNGYQTQLNATVASGLTVFRPGYTQLAGSTSNYVALSSEL